MKGGMDFPDDITTNVFRVGDIKEIHWVFFTTRPKEESALQSRPLNKREEDVAYILQLAESTLREDGHHVLLNKDKAGVWVFSLSQPLDEGIVRSLGLDFLESNSVGCVRSGDLPAAINASAPPSINKAHTTQSTVAAIGELNTQAHGLNASSSTQPPIVESGHKRRQTGGAGQNHPVSEVYSCFVSAVSCSLSHSLGKAQGWIQVEPYACIDVRTLGDDLFNDSQLHPGVGTTTRLSFDVKWLSSGTLLTSFSQLRLPRHTRISTMISEDGCSTGLAIGSPVLLSPFGIKCQYLGTEKHSKSDGQRKSTFQEKASTLSRLAPQGIKTVPGVTWIQVQMGRESDFFVGPPVTVWPADLCFCEDVTIPVSGEEGESVSRSIVDGTIDPLEEAESWFLEKATRMRVLQARVREEEQKDQAMEVVENTDDEDALSPYEIAIDQGITPQDVSGIYPTPPDALPPGLLGSSHPSNLQPGDYDDEEKELQQSDEARGEYDGQQQDDLFGDMDIEMFASNGLTEADFSFFDEPGMNDDDLQETDQAMVLGDTDETTDPPMAFDEHRLLPTPHERPDSGPDRNVTDDRKDAIHDQEDDQVSPIADDHSPVKDYDRRLEATVKRENVDHGALDLLSLQHVTTFPHAQRGKRGSFEHVPFQELTLNLDDKYKRQGRFAFDVDELPIHSSLGDRRSHFEHYLSESSVCLNKSPMEDSSITDDEEDEAPAPEDSDAHHNMDISLESQAEPSRKRKREQLEEDDHVSPSSSIPPAQSFAGSPQNEVDERVSSLLEPIALEQTKSLVDLKPRFHERSKPSFAGKGQSFIKVAQLITHQAASGLLQSLTKTSEEINLVGKVLPDRSLLKLITQLLAELFPTSKRCSLKEYFSLCEKSPASASREQVVPTQRILKPNHHFGGLNNTGQSIFKLDSPYTRVRRNGISIEISASALSFWEELSLGPSHETKDIDVFCVCPNNKYIEEGAIAFLNMIKGAYQSCNLGSHDFGASFADYKERIITAPMDGNKPDSFLQNIASACEGLFTKLPELGLHSGTTVIYIINPFKDQQYLPKLCNALLRLPSSYGAALERRRLERQNNFAMQLVPLDLVWSPERIVVPSPAAYRRLAFEVYNNCGSSESGRGRSAYFMSAPAIRLAKAVPKTIDLKLASESSAPFMQSDSCVHVSYTWDASNEWLAAVWTDNLGVLSRRACYCLGKNEQTPWKPFYEAVEEILETSFEMLHPPNAPWRLFICKDSPMYKVESDAWLRVFAESSRPSTSCTLLTVDENPNLTLTQTDLQRPSSDLPPGLLATPGATPQTNTPSPEISGLGSTPTGNAAQAGTPPANAAIGDQDSEARLIDVTDETWGVVMDGTIDDMSIPSIRSTSLASGYLIKRAGPRDEDGLSPMGVNVVHGQKPYVALLKEVLGMFRNLGTLARVRGEVDPVKSVLPLHVAAARKAWRALSETMRYEPE